MKICKFNTETGLIELVNASPHHIKSEGELREVSDDLLIQDTGATTLRVINDVITVVDRLDFIPVIDSCKHNQKRMIASARYDEEMGGFTLPAEQGGMSVRTDGRNRTLLVGAAMNALADPTYTVENWKTDGGEFITLDAQTIGILYAALQVFLAKCFQKEATLSAEIDAATTVEDIQAINYII